jgi:hypothetical protein
MIRFAVLPAVVILLTGLSRPVTSHAQDAASHWQAIAGEAGLSTDRQWLALLHYDFRSPTRRRSYVDDPRFFLSPAGDTDSAAELAATLASFFADPSSQCRFIARRNHLVSALDGLEAALPQVRCETYQAWRTNIDASEVVLVLASSYLNSPSSMYGHTFLRFDPVGAETPLLSYALNFGAKVDGNDNGLLYAWRGIAGGYPGTFAAALYLDKSKEYTRLENRDLWEYHLNLTPTEVDRMLAHIWELDEINFDYYFFDENCSYRLLELIDVARPGLDLADDFAVFAIPVDTVRVVEEAGLVDRIVYRPADQTIIEDRIRKLGPTDAGVAFHLATDIDVRDETAFSALAPEQQGEVTDVAYKYFRYINNTKTRTPEIARQSFALLSMQPDYSLPASFTAPPPTPARPDQGHGTMLLAVAAGTAEQDAFVDLEWRLTYHDLLDPVAGYPRGMSLNMGRFVVRGREGAGLRLQEVDLVEIRSLSPRDQFFRPWSWQVQTGADRQWTAGSDELVPQVNGGVGLSYAAPLDGLVFGLLQSRLEYNNNFNDELDIAGGFMFGYLRQGKNNNTLLELEQLWFTQGSERTALTVGQDFLIKRNNALRLHLKRQINDSQGNTEIGLGYRHYF